MEANRECSCKVLKLSAQRQGCGRAVRRDRWATRWATCAA
jgi:hypothetical protein